MAVRTGDFLNDEPPQSSAAAPESGGDVELLQRQDGFSGAISLPLLPDLIQIYTVAMADGALTIRRGMDRGTIWFERGEMTHAVCGALVGEEAVYRLMEWRNGHFAFDPEARSAMRSIASSWQSVLMEGCRRMDEGVASEEASIVEAPRAELAESLSGFCAAALFNADGALIAQQYQRPEHDLVAAGPDVVEMLRRQAAVMTSLSRADALLDCFLFIGDQLHFVAPLAGGRVLYVIVQSSVLNVAVIRRQVDRVAARLQ
ncbi:MAG TPA: DUF4388 domain-containing protein [Thermoanaerobaculia bacterium]|jgi:hypothetical protein